MNDCYVIIGSYRSGTSVIAKIMNSLGIDMSQRVNFTDNVDWYPTGSFNDRFSNYISTNPDTYWKLKIESNPIGKLGIRSFDYLKKNAWAKFTSQSKKSINLIWANRNVVNCFNEYKFLIGKQAVPDIIEKQFETCQNIFNSFSNRKIIINYSDLMQNTVLSAKQIADFCGVLYTDECVNEINPKYLE